MTSADMLDRLGGDPGAPPEVPPALVGRLARYALAQAEARSRGHERCFHYVELTALCPRCRDAHDGAVMELGTGALIRGTTFPDAQTSGSASTAPGVPGPAGESVPPAVSLTSTERLQALDCEGRDGPGRTDDVGGSSSGRAEADATARSRRSTSRRIPSW